MVGKIDARLAELGLSFETSPPPVANYVPCVRTGQLIFVSGQIPRNASGVQSPGCVGKDVSVEQATAAAKLAATHVLSAVRTALGGDLDRVTRVVKVTAFVNAPEGFAAQSDIANGASDLFVAVFGDAGRHARAAVGVSSLPRNACVEVEAVFEVA
jgi:enamine deaminase RidA (YjgF/YER057c/UK114 family)